MGPRQAPVFYAAELGYIVISRYTEIKAIFDNWASFASDNAQAPVRPLCDEAKRIMREGGFTAYSGLSARIPPDHTRIRKVFQSCFGPRRFQAIEPAIRAIITRAIDAFDPSGKIDFLPAFAYDFPALVLFKLVGIPDTDVPKVKLWSVSRALLTWGNSRAGYRGARSSICRWNRSRYVRDYVSRLEAGQVIDRPTAEIAAERDRITAEYADLLNPEMRPVFEAKLGLASTVFPYVENHNFYIEHWSMSIFWRKMRQLGTLLRSQNFWADPNDIFYLNRQEVRDALFDYGNAWGVGGSPIGPHFWPAEIESRKHIMAALATQPPQPALNEPPAVITEPFTIMLWGITSESIAKWLDGAQDATKLSGMAASPGVVEGRARVVLSADDLGTILDGEILITRVTAPSWAPVFGKIRATVTDIGGMMSHAAIVCREYGLPAVTGTGNASTRIKTGDMLRVDGSTGEVMILAD